jgi:hypothetical protein
MRFITIELDMQYDYFITLSGSSFPLWGAIELAQFLFRDEYRARIGRMIYWRGGQLCRKYMNGFGLIMPAFHNTTKIHLMQENFVNILASQNTSGVIPDVNNYYPRSMELCRTKTNSGNTAAYDRAAIVALLNNATALDFLSRFKQAGTVQSVLLFIVRHLIVDSPNQSHFFY